jgi:hypothetical protein
VNPLPLLIVVASLASAATGCRTLEFGCVTGDGGACSRAASEGHDAAAPHAGAKDASAEDTGLARDSGDGRLDGSSGLDAGGVDAGPEGGTPDAASDSGAGEADSG